MSDYIVFRRVKTESCLVVPKCDDLMSQHPGLPDWRFMGFLTQEQKEDRDKETTHE